LGGRLVIGRAAHYRAGALVSGGCRIIGLDYQADAAN